MPHCHSIISRRAILNFSSRLATQRTPPCLPGYPMIAIPLLNQFPGLYDEMIAFGERWRQRSHKLLDLLSQGKLPGLFERSGERIPSSANLPLPFFRRLCPRRRGIFVLVFRHSLDRLLQLPSSHARGAPRVHVSNRLSLPFTDDTAHVARGSFGDHPAGA